MSRTLRLLPVLTVATSALLLAAPGVAHAAVTNVAIGCRGASGNFSSFGTLVEARVGDKVIGFDASPTPTWSIDWSLEGDHVVTLWDRTSGNDYDLKHPEEGNKHGGPESHYVGTYKLSCPVATTTTAPAPTTTLPATTTTQAPTTTVQATTTTVAPETTVTVEPTTSTTVVLPPPPAPSSTTPKQQAIPTTTAPETTAPVASIPVPVLVVDPSIPTTTVAATTSTDGAIDRGPVPTDAKSTTVRTDPLPATGGNHTPAITVGTLALALGAVAVISARRRPNHSA